MCRIDFNAIFGTLIPMRKRKEERISYTLANLFGNNPDVSVQERSRVMKEVERFGGLTFTVQRNAEGWFAQCNEVRGIITGNTNPSPTAIEIESQIRDAIFSAFNVKFEKSAIASPFGFEYAIDHNHNAGDTN